MKPEPVESRSSSKLMRRVHAEQVRWWLPGQRSVHLDVNNLIVFFIFTNVIVPSGSHSDVDSYECNFVKNKKKNEIIIMMNRDIFLKKGS